MLKLSDPDLARLRLEAWRLALDHVQKWSPDETHEQVKGRLAVLANDALEYALNGAAQEES